MALEDNFGAGRVIVAHYGELWLRGKNRNFYIKLLLCNIRHALKGMRYELYRKYDRIVIKADNKELERIRPALAKVFGISSYEVASVSEPKLERIAELAVSLARERGTKSIKINAHRSDKRLGFDSKDVIAAVSRAAKSSGIEPRLDGYEAQVFASITSNGAYLYTDNDKERGAAGLPVGSEGKCVVLISGGIDSPVAAWFAMKRGLAPIYVHVHAFQSNGDAMSGKIADLLGVLAAYSNGYKAYFVPSYAFDAAAAAARTERYTLVLLKNFMLRVAQRVALMEGAGAIVTGESLGQVASQSLENLAAEAYGIRLPIIRPLIGFDKEEIIHISKRIHTYEESIRPYKDVCSISAKNPKTKSRIEEIKELSSKMKIGVIVNKSLKAAAVLEQH
ncbi:MAG: tRNA uracil 4-sulfurtransferase ThiI [Candidatus Micrarchaeaceae archaeon]